MSRLADMKQPNVKDGGIHHTQALNAAVDAIADQW